MTNQELKELLSCFESSSLGKMKLSTQEFTIELERPCAAAPAVPVPASAAAAVPTQPQAPAGGTVTAPSPDQPPFVKVGDRVKKGDTLCLIEAMKMMSELPAPCDCEITAVLKENGALVSFGEALFGYQPC